MSYFRETNLLLIFYYSLSIFIFKFFQKYFYGHLIFYTSNILKVLYPVSNTSNKIKKNESLKYKKKLLQLFISI
jgi:hypothetical protein